MWFGQSFRKVHNLYVSPQWAQRRGEAFDAVAYADALADAGVDCLELYCKDHHGTCYYPCSTGIAYPRNILGELLPELKKRSIRLIAYFSVCFDNYALGLHPEWRMVNSHGDPYRVGPFYMASVCSPYVEFAVKQLRELAQGYDVDGFWLDIIPLARDVPQETWMIAPHPVPDYSLYAQKSYEAETGRALPLHADGSQAEHVFQFMTDKVEALLGKMFAVIRQSRPEAIITYNAAGAPGDPLDMADLTSIEGHAPNYSRQSFISRWARMRGKPFEILTAGALPRTDLGGGWNGFDQKPVTIMRLESALAVAHGGSAVIGQAPYPDGSVDPAQMAGFTRVFQPIREIESWCVAPKSISDVGLVLSPKVRTASALWGVMQDGAEAFHEAMLDGHVQFDIVSGQVDLSAYQAVVVPDQAALSDVEVDHLREYVRSGGKLLASGRTSLWDERGQRRTDFGLADVFGITFDRESEREFVYLRLRSKVLSDAVTSLPILIDRSPLQVTTTTAEILADFIYPEAYRTHATTILWGDSAPDATHRHPGIVHNPYGKGQCWYVASSLKARGMPNAWVKCLMRTLAMNLVELPVLKTDAPPGVEVILNGQPQGLVIHLINYYSGDVERLSWPDHSLTVRQVAVQLNMARFNMAQVRRVYALPNTDLDYHVADGWLVIQSPSIEIHAVLIVSFES